MGLVLVIILILLVIGVLPAWPHARWGYGPSGGLTVVLVIILLLVLFGHL